MRQVSWTSEISAAVVVTIVAVSLAVWLEWKIAPIIIGAWACPTIRLSRFMWQRYRT